MLSNRGHSLLGAVGFFGFVLNTAFWGALILIMAPAKYFTQRWMVRCAENWISINNFGLDHLYRIDWKIDDSEWFDPQGSYLILSNHRSWVDIVVLQRLFNRRIPFLRFFLKRELLYVPILGPVWWALDFPFMKRHGKEALLKDPQKRRDDQTTILRATRRFRGRPVSILNFAEGTRLTLSKRGSQNPPYRHLLKPKAGGLSIALSELGDQFTAVIDVTLFYPRENLSLWQFLCGRIDTIRARVKSYPVPIEILNDEIRDETRTRENIQSWIHQVWTEKDQVLETWKTPHEKIK